MILIITQSNDVHYLEVVKYLPKNSYVSLNVKDLYHTDFLSYSVDGSNEKLETNSINFSNINCIWVRRIVCPELRKTEDYFINDTFKSLIFGASMVNKNIVYFPKIHNVLLADNKIYELHLAKKYGLNIPKTIIGNSVKQVKEFCKDKKEIIIKPLDRAVQTDQSGNKKTMSTVLMKTSDFISHINLVQNLPVIVQESIKKLFELRITIIDKKVFACEIHSQDTDNEQTKIDYRGDKNIPHKIHDLPKEIEQKLFAIMEEMKIDFGCVDMIVTPDNEYVFLEINMNGQWLWIERFTGMPIAKAIADKLLSTDI